ncbi:MAG: efflux RND transporter periplasmic adaptor subunit [Clostridia bacterium]|nr:efflux RND transporter periplasmic adaptor subunit [Clostridia bacterium]
MKSKTLCLIATLLIICVMWYCAPSKSSNSKIYDTIYPTKENLYDIVVAHGYVEETNKRVVRLEQSGKIEKMYVSIGDFVNEGSILFDVSETDEHLSDVVNSLSNLPKIDSLSDIEKFYKYKKLDAPIPLTPQITAPIAGVVTDISANEGDIAFGQLPIVTISDFNNLCIKASVPELYIKDIRIGQSAEITGDAFAGKKYIGHVINVSPIAEKKINFTGSTETTIEVTLALSSENYDLRPGYNVNARIYTTAHKNALTIPYTAIFQEKDKEYVYTVTEGKAVKKAIRTGVELEDRVEVLGGVRERDIIIKNIDEKFIETMAKEENE